MFRATTYDCLLLYKGHDLYPLLIQEGINLRALRWHKAVETAPSAIDEWRFPAGDWTCPKEPNDPNQQKVV